MRKRKVARQGMSGTKRKAEVKKKRKVEHQGVKHCSGAFYVLESSK